MGFIEDLQEARQQLNALGDIKKIKQYIAENMEEDVEQIVAEFHKNFDGVAKDNPLRINTLITLAEIGILIY
jgi:hypothetical protein